VVLPLNDEKLEELLIDDDDWEISSTRKKKFM